ncbi:MAG TPA: penicillin-binding protein 2 [Patescibacteria group bacterium]|nr:penicillin-binding protein 2 [Patescibacteria group bacterium]
MATKIRFLSIVFGLLFAALIIRLFYWQIVKADTLSQQAKLQYGSAKITKAPRGNILASDESFWAVRTDAWLIYSNNNLIKDDKKRLANKLAAIFAIDIEDKAELLAETERLEALLSKKGSYIPLKQKVTTEIKKNVEALKIVGINFEQQEIRYYPEASSSAQLLGFVGKNETGDDIGYFGLEGYYNLPLSGKSGFVGGEKDAKGAPLLINGSQKVTAISGVDLATSIDKRIQRLAEEKLKEGIEKYGAKGGSVTVMDPYSGNILAMASLPSFDPNKYNEYSDAVFKNPIISNSFEPGSIFKVLVVAAGLDSGVIKPDTECDICSGPLKIDKYEIKTWNNKYTAHINMTDVIVESDNVGMSFIGQKLGQEKLYDYLNNFGIGKVTGIDLQGESAPQMRKKGTWSDVDLATTSFGQGIAVTGIQMVRAVAVIANGGYLVSPHVVDSLVGDGWQEKTKTNIPVRIISSEAASETAEMMYQATDRGEAKWAKIAGFKVAGKTGTAQIPIAGHYDLTNTNHSFVGFAPVGKPKFVMLVTLHSPQTSPWAAETAAPLWFSVARDLFPYLGVQPTN